MKVRIGFGFGGAAWGQAAATDFAGAVDALEEQGFDSLWLAERISSAAPDPLVALAVAAGRTASLKLGTSVVVLPGRNPVILAKELASLDVLSGGRLLPAFGLGVADPVERQAFGVAGPDRPGMLEEGLAVLRAAWTGQPVHFAGRHFHYDGLVVQPRPVRSGFDVWLGGSSPPALGRVARLADGWLPSFTTPAEAGAGRRTIERLAGEAGRSIDPEHFGVLVFYARGPVPDPLVRLALRRRPQGDPAELFPSGWDELGRTLDRFEAEGFSKFVLVPAVPPADWGQELALLAGAVLDRQGTR